MARRVTSKILGSDASEHSLGDVKTIKYGKYLLSEFIYQRNRALFINLTILNHIELNILKLHPMSMNDITEIFGMMLMRSLIIS